MQQRVLASFAELDSHHGNDNILVVCHSGIMAALMAHYRGEDFGRHNISEAYPHDYIGVLKMDNATMRSFDPMS